VWWIALLRRPEGAAVDEVATTTGKQRHTVRGVFSGNLDKACAHDCVRRTEWVGGCARSRR
jgi:hypothetical protein